MSDTTLLETATYRLVTGIGEWDSPCKGFPVYKLINLVTGLVEGESVSYPDSIAFLLTRTEALETMLEAHASFGQVEIPDGAYH
jgi:hypothetical protein